VFFLGLNDGQSWILLQQADMPQGCGLELVVRAIGPAELKRADTHDIATTGLEEAADLIGLSSCNEEAGPVWRRRIAILRRRHLNATFCSRGEVGRRSFGVNDSL
jgi:hypothetical protein